MAAEKIRNVGPKSAAWLRQVGVRTFDDLKSLGAVETFLKVKRAGFKPSLNLLYSMEGALEDCHWTDLPDQRKEQLLAAYESAEAANPIRNRWDKQAIRSRDRDGDGGSGAQSGDKPDDGDGFGEADHGVRELTGGDGEFS